LFVGCSGWSYRDWRGPFYDPALTQKQWFGYYASQFATVEVNNTFYRLPEAATFQHWAAQAPPGFVYALKVNRFGTHRRKLREPSTWLPTYIERAVLLGRSLGPNLVQLPPHWHCDPERLAEFLHFAASARDHDGHALRWAVEFRDPSWLEDRTFEVLAKYGAALCCHDLLPDHPWVRTTDWAYARFHGPDAVNAKYTGEYGRQRLDRPAHALAQWARQGCDVYAYFNNDIGGAAVRDAAALGQRLSSS
jgi:uncharacterized protein YecE (DUF72 family)